MEIYGDARTFGIHFSNRKRITLAFRISRVEQKGEKNSWHWINSDYKILNGFVNSQKKGDHVH